MSLRLRQWAVLLALLAGAACHDPNSYSIQGTTNPSGTPIDDILAVVASPTSVPADGLSRTRITASIDPRSTVRDFAFETSLGTLLSGARTSAADGKLTMTADGSGNAEVQLQSAAVVGSAHVTVTIGTVVRALDVPFSAVAANALFTLTAGSSSLPADSYSMTEITAALKISGDLRQQVKFTTSLGTLVTSTSDTTKVTERTITANADGAAAVFLRSENTVGVATVKAEVNGFARELTVNFTPVVASEVITLRATPNPVAADGPQGTGTLLTATISPSIPARLRTVEFRTSAGQFTSNLVESDVKHASVTVDAGNLATLQLVTASPVTANVTANVAGVSARVNVEFIRAAPSAMSIQSSEGTVDRTGAGAATITVYLIRDSGQVSPNTVVSYKAVGSAGTVIGTFSEITLATIDTTDSSTTPRLKATAKFNPDDTAAAGTATITANVGGVSASTLVQLR